MAIDRASLRVPVRRKAVEQAPLLGGDGEVILQAIDLQAYLAISAIDDSAERLFSLLARAAVAPDGEPLLTAAQWRDHSTTDGGREECIRLGARVTEMLRGDAAGNGSAPT